MSKSTSSERRRYNFVAMKSALEEPTKKSSSSSLRSRSSSSASASANANASVSPVFDTKLWNAKVKIPAYTPEERITMGELKNTNLQEYERVKPDFNNEEQIAHLEWQGLEELSEDAFDTYYYAPDLEQDDEPPEYEDDSGIVGHPAFITPKEIVATPALKFKPLNQVADLSAEVATHLREKISKKLRQISKLKLFSMDGDKVLVNKDIIPYANELQQIIDKSNDINKALQSDYSKEQKGYIQEAYKIRQKLFTFPCRVAKQNIGYWDENSLYQQIYLDIYNLISEYLEDNIVTIFNKYPSAIYNNVFESLGEDDKKTLIKYSIKNKNKNKSPQEMTDAQIDAETERIYREYESKAVPGGGGQMPYRHIYFQDTIFPYLKDAMKEIQLNKLRGPNGESIQITKTLTNSNSLSIYDNKIYTIFLSCNSNIPTITPELHHMILHNLTNPIQQKILKLLNYYQALKRCFKMCEELLRKAGYILSGPNNSRYEPLLIKLDEAWTLVPVDKYSFNINSYPSYLVSLKNIHNDIIDVISRKNTKKKLYAYNEYEAKLLEDYEKDALLYGPIVTACDKMKQYILMTGAKKSNPDVKEICKRIKKIQELLPIYKKITTKISVCGFKFINNPVGYFHLMGDIYNHYTQTIQAILEQKEVLFTSLHNSDLYLPVDPNAIEEAVKNLHCILHYIDTAEYEVYFERSDKKRKSPPREKSTSAASVASRSRSSSSSNSAFQDKFQIKKHKLVPDLSDPQNQNYAYRYEYYIAIKDMIVLLEYLRKVFRMIIHIRNVQVSAMDLNIIGYSITDIENLLTYFPANQTFLSSQRAYAQSAIIQLVNNTREFIQDYVNLMTSEYQLGDFANRETAAIHPLLIAQQATPRGGNPNNSVKSMSIDSPSPKPKSKSKKKSSSVVSMEIDQVAKPILIPKPAPTPIGVPHPHRVIHRAKRIKK
jgi:hypothetical protein